MASFFGAAIRLALRRRPAEGRMAEEYAQNLAGRPQEDLAVASASVPAVVPVASQVPGPANSFVPGSESHRSVYLNPEEDPLTFFRLMLGIQTSPYLGFTITSHLGTRPAANIGLYARIIHSEQKAKDSFKVFSVVINGCYFLQIVIAAALTALGAARASSGAVTAFGALNTVIAGLLTFLKGSGLPGRLKYYGNEWKKIREFIEQRERDFMRSGHNLDVYEVVETIEKMYNNLKADIELNTPDSYTSVTNLRQVGDNKNEKIGGIDMSKLESLATKLKGFDDGKLESLTSGITKRAEGVTKTIHQAEKGIHDEVQHLKEDIVQDVQSHKARLDREAKEREARARAAITEGKQAVKNGVDEQRMRLDQTAEEHKKKLDDAASEQHARALETISSTGRAAQEGIESTTSYATGSISNLVREISDIHQTAITGGRKAAAQQIRNLAQRLGVHDDKHEEPKPEAGRSEK
ncbi:hypothetical protein FHL15_001539 [Xylaria flabelliformis]|uniref:SMODS and SLOG-associating 2TM effector domain-containing protein n=1 Tax=Xylaria flabelliformis TaxID=2512241 RepID=A0A553IC70_9PEZI|nr:hypothetical protein FHL15_001539 [Xylaria flabelliformis]